MNAIITLGTTLLVSVISLIKAFKAEKKIQEIHIMINSRIDELLALTAKSSHAEGVKEELDRVK